MGLGYIVPGFGFRFCVGYNPNITIVVSISFSAILTYPPESLYNPNISHARCQGLCARRLPLHLGLDGGHPASFNEHARTQYTGMMEKQMETCTLYNRAYVEVVVGNNG